MSGLLEETQRGIVDLRSWKEGNTAHRQELLASIQTVYGTVGNRDMLNCGVVNAKRRKK